MAWGHNGARRSHSKLGLPSAPYRREAATRPVSVFLTWCTALPCRLAPLARRSGERSSSMDSKYGGELRNRVMESGVDTLKSLCSPAARWGGAPTRHSRAVRPRTSVHGSVVTARPPPNNRAAERKSAVEKNGGGSLSCLPRCSLLRHNTLLRRRPWPLLRIVDRGLPSTALSDRLLPQRSGPTLQASM